MMFKQAKCNTFFLAYNIILAILHCKPHAFVYRMTILNDLRYLHFRIPNLTITDDDFDETI